MSTTPPPAPKPESDIPPHRYTAALANEIELRWQRAWMESGAFRVPNPGEPGFDAARPKFYCLDMFPYPSGAGLHVGHPEGYTATDIISRYMRMNGRNVLHPMGWDAFGLPAEQYAIQTNVHPAVTTRKAIDTFRRQLQRFGFSYDWSREIATIDPQYYKWTQWIFLQLYNAWYDAEADEGRGKARPISELIQELEGGAARVGPGDTVVRAGVSKPLSVIGGGDPVGTRRWHELSPAEQRRFIDAQRLAYVDEVTVNWCPKLGTVLANEEVIDGKSERGGYPVYRRPLRQWMFRITAYAERLLDDLKLVDWPESTRTQQIEWIGRSEGAEIDFSIADSESETVRVFTTRPDTIFGATYLVVAPEHPLVERLLRHPRPSTDVSALRDYVEAARNKADVDRMAEGGADAKEKTGVPTGLTAVNPATGERIPVWVADYVLMGYGHGAIMAVPAHDDRDYAFAKKFGLPIRDVVYTRTEAALAFYARNATQEERTTDRWRTVLADFMGLVTTAETAPEIFPQILDAVRQRRESSPPPAADGGGLPNMRGSIAGEWHATFEGMSLTTFADLERLFGAADHYARAGAAMTAPGFAVNSSNNDVSLDGLPTEEAKARIIEWLEKTGNGNRKVTYRLRDWLFSRQRYWGEPFPIVWDEQGNHYPVSESALPVTLPEMADFVPPESPDPMPLLAKAADWVNTTAGEAGVSPELLRPDTPVRRETNTMPNWAGSCWYYLRFCDPHNSERFVSPEAEAYWMGDRGVDLYIGGSEHAVLHLLYARFWHKVLYDLGHVSTPEPFARLFHQGLITAYSYQRPDGALVPTDQVEEVSEGKFVEKATGTALKQVVAKMSKSLKNVINPDDVIAEYGADTFRLYEMYMGPLEASKPWNTRDIVGPFRFLQRLWRNLIDENTGRCTVTDAEPDEATLRLLHKTIKAVRQGIEALSFNTAIARLIELNNHLTTVAAASGGVPRMVATPLVLMLSPFAPHIAEELWHRMGREGSTLTQHFPVHDDRYAADESVEIPIQIQGKVRHKITVPASADAKTIEAAALAEPRVQELLQGRAIRKVIVVPGRMVNIVV